MRGEAVDDLWDLAEASYNDHMNFMKEYKQTQEMLRQPETKYRMPIEHMLDELYLNRETVTGEEILSTLSEYSNYFIDVIRFEFLADKAATRQANLNYYSEHPKEIPKSGLRKLKKDVKELHNLRDELEDILGDFEKKHNFSRKKIKEYILPLYKETRSFFEEIGKGHLARLYCETEIIAHMKKYLIYYAPKGFEKSEKYTRTEAEKIFNKSLEEFNPKREDELIKQNLLNDAKEFEMFKNMSLREVINYILDSAEGELRKVL